MSLLTFWISLLVLLLWNQKSEGRDKLYTVNKDTLLSSSQDVWFENLSEEELKDHWSQDNGDTVQEKIAALQNIEETILVDVKLVGFNKDGKFKINILETEIMKYLDLPTSKFRQSPSIIEVQGEHDLDDDEESSSSTSSHHSSQSHHSLPFVTKFLWRVSKAHASIVNKISEALDNAILPQLKAKQDLYLVPYTAVDDIIKDGYLGSGLSYTIYVLNPAIRQYTVPAATSVRYAYSQENQTDGTTCSTVVWASTFRYAWIDLTAGPISYGPQTSGDGIVTEYSLPRLENYFVGGEAKSIQAAKHHFIAELVAVLRASARQLLTPSIWKFPIPYRNKIIVNVVYIKEGKTPSTENLTETVWAPMEEEITSLALAGQSISVRFYESPFDECELCVSAYTHSLKTHTSNVLSDGLRTQVHQYLDSAEMHDWLEHYDNSFWGIRAASINETIDMEGEVDIDPNSVRVITVFLYDFKTEDILLLDRYHQAVPFKNMVIAVQSHSPPAVLDYRCDGKSVQYNSRRAYRPLLAALLQTGWGISPTYLSWNPLYNETQEDYLWATGFTPFGYFSPSMKLSFAIKDAAARHVVYTDINQTMTELHTLLTHFASYESELDEVATAQEHLTFIRRWNVFSFKLKKAHYFLQHQHHNQSLYYIRSARHDLTALHHLVHTFIDRFKSSIVCFQHDTTKVKTVLGLTSRDIAKLIALLIILFLIKKIFTDIDSSTGRLRRLFTKTKKY